MRLHNYEKPGCSGPIINLLVNEVLQRTPCDYSSVTASTDISYHMLQAGNNFFLSFISSAFLFHLWKNNALTITYYKSQNPYNV